MAPTATTVLKLEDKADEKELLICDDLIRARAVDKNQIPLLCFPKTERDIVEYIHYTGADIDRFVDHAAKYYLSKGLKPEEGSHGQPQVVSLLAHTNLAYIVTFFALARLGYTALLLSPRLAPNAIEKLCKETGSVTIIPGNTAPLANLVSQTNVLFSEPLQLIKQITLEDFDKPMQEETRFQRENIDRVIENRWQAAILHSSGTTGLPKPIYIPNYRTVMRYPGTKGSVQCDTFPFFHAYGNYLVLHGILARKTTYLYNSHLALTADYMIKVLEHVRPNALHVVPYTMELLAQTERGVNALRACNNVVFSGAGCPSELGDYLVEKGVMLETRWGATELGMLGSSDNREPGDDAWDYIRIAPFVQKFIWMKPLDGNEYEAVYLHGLPTLVASNSDDPPKSFHSKDIFVKHPKMDAWKHIGRLDDRLTLINGEKILPVPIEGRVRQDPLIKECCVFGIGRSIPGILVFRNDKSMDMPDSTFIDAIWPTIQKANAHAENFSQISKETIVPISADADYAKTDKESIKRAQIYGRFSKEIEAMYENLESAATGTMKLNVPDLERWLMKTFNATLSMQVNRTDDDLFAAGVSSLQAIQMRGLILKHLDLGGNATRLERNVIFDTGTVARLAKQLDALRLNKMTPEKDEDEIRVMETMIKSYSSFKKRDPSTRPAPEKQAVVLTGATGSLGTHILAQLLNQPNGTRVYCLVRGDNPRDRVLQALQQRNLTVPATGALIALSSNLSRPDLGLTSAEYSTLVAQTTTIIHSAWAVNFNLGVRSFEAQHIVGVHNLLQLSLSVPTPKPARFFFCSSIAAALGTRAPATILEAPMYDLNAALPQGYARSKLVAEHIGRNAGVNFGAITRNLRIGQIVGDGKTGLWNDTESFPLIIRSALTLNALPALDETESWLPADTLASTILELAGITTAEPPAADDDHDLVYNLQNPHTFSWTRDLLPELKRCGLDFETVPVAEWLQKLSDYEEAGVDIEENPAVKLLGHFDRVYGAERRMGGVKFEIETAERHSESLRYAPRIIEEGYVRKFVAAWLDKWNGEGKGVCVNGSGLADRTRG